MLHPDVGKLGGRWRSVVSIWHQTLRKRLDRGCRCGRGLWPLGQGCCCGRYLGGGGGSGSGGCHCESARSGGGLRHSRRVHINHYGGGCFWKMSEKEKIETDSTFFCFFCHSWSTSWKLSFSSGGRKKGQAFVEGSIYPSFHVSLWMSTKDHLVVSVDGVCFGTPAG